MERGSVHRCSASLPNSFLKNSSVTTMPSGGFAAAIKNESATGVPFSPCFSPMMPWKWQIARLEPGGHECSSA